MSGMIIHGVAVFGGIFDQVVAWDFLVNALFGSTALAWAAKIATWSAIFVTIMLTAFAVLRRMARIFDAALNAIEVAGIAFKKALRFRFWTLVASHFWAAAKLALRGYKWAASKRK